MVKHLVWIAILIAPDARADEPPQLDSQGWSIEVRLGGHVALDTLPNYEGAFETTRPGPSLDVEIAHSVVPRVELGAFGRVDVHRGDLESWLAVASVGMRARMLVGDRVFVAVGASLVRAHEDTFDPATWGVGIEGDLGLVLATIRHVTFEAIVATGRFTNGGPEFETDIPWISMSLGARFQ